MLYELSCRSRCGLVLISRECPCPSPQGEPTMHHLWFDEMMGMWPWIENMASWDLQVCILLCGGHCGPGSRLSKLLLSCARSSLVLVGGQDCLHGSDAASAVVMCMGGGRSGWL